MEFLAISHGIKRLLLSRMMEHERAQRGFPCGFMVYMAFLHITQCVVLTH